MYDRHDRLYNSEGEEKFSDERLEEEHLKTHEDDQSIIVVINESLELQKYSDELLTDEGKNNAFQLMYYFLRHWAIQSGLYSSPGRQLHNNKIQRMILQLPVILSFSQVITSPLQQKTLD